MSSRAELVCGIDVGSQGSCLSVFDAGGDRVATTYQPHPLSYPRPGWAEQDPRDWRAALVNGFRDLSAHVNLRHVRALSFGSQLDGLVCVDRHGQPAGPAIIWMDRRADGLCRELEQRVSVEEWYARSGCNLDGSHVAAKIAWVRRERPAVHARTRRYLLPGAYMVALACGADAVDRSNASSTMLLDPNGGDWHPELLGAWEVEADRLPPVVGAEQPLGTVTAGFADQTGLQPDCLVVCGCGDEMAATLGAGVIDAGSVCDVLGTAEPVCAASDWPLRDPTRVAECHPHAAPGRWLLENPGWASGANYRWFRDELASGQDYEALNLAAEAAPPGSDGLVFLPWMGGAMAPRWEADARGSWYGLTPAHGRGHLLRSLLEGSAFAFRDVVDAIRAAGLQCDRVVCVSGAARSALVRQLRADVTGLPVTWSEDVETTSRGAAMLAAAGAGLHATVADAAAAMCRLSGRTHEPDAAAAALLDESYRRYRRLFDALAPAFGELA
jgi:xylulokinase